MAKNDSLEQATLVTEGGDEQGPSIKDVQYLRKDTHLLMRGVWYMTLPCPYHGSPSGLVDEQVSWDEAKTPHHAGVVAELRHANCAVVDDAYANYLTGLQEIQAAEDLREQQAVNLKLAQERVATCEEILKACPESDPMYRVRARELDAAQALMKKHERGMLEAEKRVANTRADNER